MLGPLSRFIIHQTLLMNPRFWVEHDPLPYSGKSSSAIRLLNLGTAIERGPLHLCNQLCHRDAAWTAFRTIEDGAAAKDPQPIAEYLQACGGALVTAIKEKAMGIDNGRRTDPLPVAPDHRARTGAAGAQDTFSALIKPHALLWGLQPLGLGRRFIVDEVGQDLLILGKERIQIDDQIFNYWKGRQWLDRDLRRKLLHEQLAGQPIMPIDTHRIGPADAVHARAAEREGAIDGPFDGIEYIEQAIFIIHLDGIRRPIGALALVRIKTLNLERDSTHDTFSRDETLRLELF